MPPVPGPCARCGEPTACYWRPTPDCPERWPLCPECAAEVHRDPEALAALCEAVAAELLEVPRELPPEPVN